MDSTNVHLDGNNLSQLGPESFLGRSKVTALYLNSSKITGLSNRTFVGLTGLKELYLDHNQLVSLTGEFQFAGLSELEVLQLDNNHLQVISKHSFLLLGKLRVLSLHNNLLVSLQVEMSSQARLQAVTIHHNRWQCGDTACREWLQAVEKLNKHVIKGLNNITCKDDQQETQNMLAVLSSCKNLDVLAVSSQTSPSPFVSIIVSVAVVILLVVIIITILLSTRHSITTWIYSLPKPDTPAQHQASHCPSTAEYSAYIHYCMADDQYVRYQIAPRLETSSHKTRLCLHHRDLQTNTTVGKAISKAVAQSERLIVLASPSYFESSIPRYELQMILACMPLSMGYPIIVIVKGGEVEKLKCQFKDQVGSQIDRWTFLDVEDEFMWRETLRLIGGRENSHIPHDQSSCSSQSTLVLSSNKSDSSRYTVTLPSSSDSSNLVNKKYDTEARSKHTRVIRNPMEKLVQPDILDHHLSSGTDPIYATVDEASSEQEAFISDIVFHNFQPCGKQTN